MATIVKTFVWVANSVGQFYQRPSDNETVTKFKLPWLKTPTIHKQPKHHHIAIDPKSKERGRHSGNVFNTALLDKAVKESRLQFYTLDFLAWVTRKMMTGREKSSESCLMALCLSEAYKAGITVESIKVKDGVSFDGEAIADRLNYLLGYWSQQIESGYATVKRGSKETRTTVMLD